MIGRRFLQILRGSTHDLGMLHYSVETPIPVHMELTQTTWTSFITCKVQAESENRLREWQGRIRERGVRIVERQGRIRGTDSENGPPESENSPPESENGPPDSENTFRIQRTGFGIQRTAWSNQGSHLSIPDPTQPNPRTQPTHPTKPTKSYLLFRVAKVHGPSMKVPCRAGRYPWQQKPPASRDL